MLRHHDTITGLAWRPDTSGVLATCGTDATAALWRVTTATPGKQVKRVHRFDLDAPATAITWLPMRWVYPRAATSLGHAAARSSRNPLRATMMVEPSCPATPSGRGRWPSTSQVASTVMNVAAMARLAMT